MPAHIDDVLAGDEDGEDIGVRVGARVEDKEADWLVRVAQGLREGPDEFDDVQPALRHVVLNGLPAARGSSSGSICPQHNALTPAYSCTVNRPDGPGSGLNRSYWTALSQHANVLAPLLGEAVFVERARRADMACWPYPASMALSLAARSTRRYQNGFVPPTETAPPTLYGKLASILFEGPRPTSPFRKKGQLSSISTRWDGSLDDCPPRGTNGTLKVQNSRSRCPR